MRLVLEVDCTKQRMRYRRSTKVELAQALRDQAEGEARSRAQAYLHLRHVRDHLLRVTDHLEHKPMWAAWRQKLRDLPATADPEKPRWPKPPVAVSCLYDCRSLWPRLDWTPLTTRTN